MNPLGGPKKYDDLPPRSDPNYQKLWHQKHPDARKKYKTKFYKKHPEKIEHDLKKNREWVWKARGVKDFTYQDYEILYKKQRQKCALCRDMIDKNGFGTHLDHNHKTGKVRGILCVHCNILLGACKDSKKILKRAIEYLTHAR